VHLADALLAPVGAAIKAACDIPVTASVCGLDVTYANRAYQSVVPRALRRLDMAMPISRATDAAMRARTGVAPASCVIPLGAHALPPPTPADAAAFEHAAGPLDARRVVVTVGRLIERKGAAWFATNVLPMLPGDTVYVAIGEGDQREAIARAADSAGVGDRVRLPGRLGDGVVAAAYERAAAFVMPNIRVPGDMEGFGLVALEAASARTPVVASAVDGITEAVQHDRNGLLVAPGDAQVFAETLRSVLALPDADRRALGDRFARFTRYEYSWSTTASRYANAFTELVHARESLQIAA
jgi:glycosyltransferase involved in cell wall biosynthesis